jgi:dTDP-4-amino-4,6-dideoxygalactose transaminase
MHLRINLPPWGRAELGAGLKALVNRRSGDASREELRRALARAAGEGWSVALMSSGRAALARAIPLMGLTNRRVAVPAYACPAVPSAVRAAGAEPIAVDVKPDSIRFDPDALTRADVAGVVAANTYGLDQDFEALRDWAGARPVIEDAAYRVGRPPRGDSAIWSFNFKALTGVGGGVLLSRKFLADPPGPRARPGELARFLDYGARGVAGHRIPRFLPGAQPPGSSGPNPHTQIPAPGPMSNLQAAIALAQWHRRAEIERDQRENVRAIKGAIDGAVGLAPLDEAPFPHLVPLVVRVGAEYLDRAVLRTRRLLHHGGIQTEEPYPVPDGFPNAQDLARRLVLVPCHAAIAPRVRDRLAETVAEAARMLDHEFATRPVPSAR